jgi:pimeloyl-ACP methyl ester carboxylesterase
MYVAGTRTLRDWAFNVAIPFGMTRNLDRYASVMNHIEANNISRIVGHSMGGSVALEAGRSLPGVDVTTYGAPVISSTPGDRHRDTLDPFSAFDLGATTHGLMLPHTFKGSRSPIPRSPSSLSPGTRQSFS